MEIISQPNERQTIILETEPEVRAAALSMSAINKAILRGLKPIEGGWLERRLMQWKARKLEREYRRQFAVNALSNFATNGDFNRSSMTIEITESGAERKLLATGAKLLIEEASEELEARNAFFSNPMTRDEFEQTHTYGADFTPAVRQLAEI